MKNKISKEEYHRVMKGLKDAVASGKFRNQAEGSHRLNRFINNEGKTPNKDFNKYKELNSKKFNDRQKFKILEILKSVEQIQKSNLSTKEKISQIKIELWTKHGPKTKLLIGAFLGTVSGLAIFGSGGIGIAALGSATGIWGFLAGTTGGVLISSLIQNFEKTIKK